jgi:hypothetical protein
MNAHLATYFHLSRNFLYRKSGLTSMILSHIRLGSPERATQSHLYRLPHTPLPWT